MTKTKELKWRLKDKPTAGALASLVETGVITKDEARQMLLNEQTTDIDSLTDRIEFLEGVIKALTENKSTVTGGVNIYYPRRYESYDWWTTSAPILCDSIGNGQTYTLTASNTTTTGI